MDEESLYFISAVMAIISAFVTLLIFKSKGRSGLGGFALGFFLGIIGIVIALFMSSNQEAIQHRKFEHGKLSQCPYCKEYVKVDAIICKHCGQSFEDEEEEEEEEEVFYCIECGTRITTNDKSCKKCGWTWYS